LKQIIGNISNSLERVNALTGAYYEENEVAKKYGYDSAGKQIGLIAQEVQSVLPEVVKIAPFDANKYGHSVSGENYLTVLYSKVVPLLIEALKEQKTQIEYLKTKLK
jgi:hypothetical protein